MAEQKPKPDAQKLRLISKLKLLPKYTLTPKLPKNDPLLQYLKEYAKHDRS